jgi:hypothetical protein
MLRLRIYTGGFVSDEMLEFATRKLDYNISNIRYA